MNLYYFFNKYFGPLSKKWCNYFYFFSVFFFVLFFVSLVGILFTIIMQYKKINFMIITNFIIILVNTFIGYFVNRLLYSVCVSSLH